MDDLLTHTQSGSLYSSRFLRKGEERRRLFSDSTDDYRLSSGVASSVQTVKTQMDMLLFAIVIALLVVGITTVYSASAHEAQLNSGFSMAIVMKQMIAAAAGLVLMWMASQMNFQVWRRVAKGFSLVCIGLLLITMLFGKTANGSERWIALPLGLQFQPSDLAKLAAVFLLAQATSHRKFWTLNLWVNLALVGVMVLLIYQQPNLSVSLILASLTVAMLFIGGIPLTILALSGPPMIWKLIEKIQETPYQMRRINGWLNPWADPQDTGYNLIQSWYAIGSGGFFGVGFGQSIQKRSYLPFPYTDFIFSVICEEWGFLGATLLMGLFGLLAWRGIRIALKSPSPFGQMLAFGITFVITLQAAINLAVTVGLFPVTGVTLPLISYGGTSLIVTLWMLGILLSISRYKVAPVTVVSPEMGRDFSRL